MKIWSRAGSIKCCTQKVWILHKTAVWPSSLYLGGPTSSSEAMSCVKCTLIPLNVLIRYCKCDKNALEKKTFKLEVKTYHGQKRAQWLCYNILWQIIIMCNIICNFEGSMSYSRMFVEQPLALSWSAKLLQICLPNFNIFKAQYRKFSHIIKCKTFNNNVKNINNKKIQKKNLLFLMPLWNIDFLFAF